jgi:cytochrome d ubiquinol oxidase subunit I
MRTAEAVTGAGGIPVGYVTLLLVYLGVAVGVVWILRRLAAVPLDAGRPPEPVERGALQT